MIPMDVSKNALSSTCALVPTVRWAHNPLDGKMPRSSVRMHLSSLHRLSQVVSSLLRLLLVECANRCSG
jgi:hypothetical protein